MDRAVLSGLQLSPLFAGLPAADLALLAGQARMEVHGDDETLYRQGDAADRFYLLLDGHVEISVHEGGRRSVLDVVGRGTLLGEAAFYMDNRYPITTRSIGHARLLRIPSAPFLAALEQRFDLALRLLGAMSVRMRQLVAQIARLKLKNTAQRLAGFLLALTAKTEGPAVVRFPYDKRLAAESLGMTAESLSRALARLAELGVESRAENVVAIADLGRLSEFCAEEGEE
ncbi:transcriptional activatory protein AadR [mine drainage metagenome]|uniref:Transcriptional activatory protein AadR n=1 Tax=mine drainage metagenome TaxID=410659 RepID=A0A1J5S2S9_9ZZZZ